MSAETVFQWMWDRYASAVNANDSQMYGSLFTEDAIRMMPGAEPEHGREAIQRAEQADYDVTHWNISSTPLDVLQIEEDWIYGVAHVDATITAYSDGARTCKEITAAWLMQRQRGGEWLIARHILTVKSVTLQ